MPPAFVKKISIEIIPHGQQRYETPGDYWYDEDGVLQVRVSDLGNHMYERMVIIHELIEETLTRQKGISEQAITDFDVMYEKKRQQGLHSDTDEPGFDNESPYLLEHTLATAVEMQMCALAGIKWNEYSDAFKDLQNA